jgi:hypothetical protein
MSSTSESAASASIHGGREVEDHWVLRRRPEHVADGVADFVVIGAVGEQFALFSLPGSSSSLRSASSPGGSDRYCSALLSAE